MDSEELNRRKAMCALHGMQYDVGTDNHWVQIPDGRGGFTPASLGRLGGQLWSVRIEGVDGMVGVRNIEEVIEHLTKQN